MTEIVVDRSAPEAATAMSGAWIAFVMVLPVLEPGIQPFDMVVGALGAAGLIIAGFAAASRVRPMSRREGRERLRLVGWSLSLGALMGVINLAVNAGMASLDPTLHQLLIERFGQISPGASVLAAPVVEEVAFRLFLLSAVAFVVARFVEDPGAVFWTALAVSALVFGVIHVLRPMPESLDLAWIYRSGVTLKSGVAGLLLGWIYWRWGLGYSMACHVAVNGAHWLLEPLVFGY